MKYFHTFPDTSGFRADCVGAGSAGVGADLAQPISIAMPKWMKRLERSMAFECIAKRRSPSRGHSRVLCLGICSKEHVKAPACVLVCGGAAGGTASEKKDPVKYVIWR